MQNFALLIAGTFCYLIIGGAIANKSMYVWIQRDNGIRGFLLFPIQWYKKSVGTIDPYRGHAHCLLLNMAEITEDSDASEWFVYRQWKMILWPLPVMWSTAACPTILIWAIFIRTCRFCFPQEKVENLLAKRREDINLDVATLENERHKLEGEIESKETRLDQINELLKLEKAEDPLEKEFEQLAAAEEAGATEGTRYATSASA